MSELQPIEVHDIGIDPEEIAGSVGEFGLVYVSELRVDPAYQRSITNTSARNIARIARGFDWRKFTPIIGVLNADGTVSVIDGQHRAAAAKSRGIDRVPVYFVKATMKEAAGAFAAINGNVTPMTAFQIFKAARAAGIGWAVAVDRACTSAGVKPLVYPVRASLMKENETLAIGTLRKMLERHGEEALTLGLRCMVACLDNSPGLVNANRIGLVVPLVAGNPSWRASPEAVVAAFAKIKLWAYARHQREGLETDVNLILNRSKVEQRSVAAEQPIKSAPPAKPRATDLAKGNGRAGEWW